MAAAIRKIEQVDHRLALVVEAWPTLPEAARQAILSIVQTTAE